MGTWRAAIVIVVALGGFVAGARGDVVYLQDGRVIRGTVVSDPDARTVVLETPYGRMDIQAVLVEKIERAAPAPASKPDQAAAVPGASSTAGSVGSSGSAGSAGSQPDREAVNLAPEDREVLVKAIVEADKSATAAEGLAAWTQFISTDGRSPQLLAAAKAKKAVWQERVDKHLGRYGPNWVPADDLAKRNAEADDLLAKAEAAATLEEACNLFDKALGAHPYRADIPFGKARRLLKGSKPAEANAAFDQVIAIDPNNAAALNNMGVMAGSHKRWPGALQHLCKAVALADSDLLFDNLDAVMAEAAKSDCPRVALVSAEHHLAQVVEALHKAGKHVGQKRWGNEWIAQADADAYAADNAKIDATEAAQEAQLATLQRQMAIGTKAAKDLADDINNRFGAFGDSGNAYTQMRDRHIAMMNQLRTMHTQEADLTKELTATVAKRHPQSHAAKLTVLDADIRTELSSVALASGS